MNYGLLGALVDDLHSLELLQDHLIELLADLSGHIAQRLADTFIVRQCHAFALGKAANGIHDHLVQLLANLTGAFLHFAVRTGQVSFEFLGKSLVTLQFLISSFMMKLL